MTNTAVATLPLIGYSAVAFAGAVLVCLRLHRSKHCSPPHNSATVLLLLSRIGLLLLTIGTLIDDMRRVFGFIEPAKNDVAVGLSWFLECNHAIGCCVCTVIGFQLMSHSVNAYSEHTPSCIVDTVIVRPPCLPPAPAWMRPQSFAIGRHHERAVQLGGAGGAHAAAGQWRGVAAHRPAPSCCTGCSRCCRCTSRRRRGAARCCPSWSWACRPWLPRPLCC